MARPLRSSCARYLTPALGFATAAMLAACGGTSTTEGGTIEASDAPTSGCFAKAKRQRLAGQLPDLTPLGYQVREQALTSFSSRPADCNEGGILYVGPRPPVSSIPRRAVLLRMQFWKDARQAKAAARSSGGEAIRLAGGPRATLFRERGRVAVRLVEGQAVVDVQLGCFKFVFVPDVNPNGTVAKGRLARSARVSRCRSSAGSLGAEAQRIAGRAHAELAGKL